MGLLLIFEGTMRWRLAFSLFLLSFFSEAQTLSPYSISWKQDGWILGLGIPAVWASHQMEDPSPLTYAEIAEVQNEADRLSGWDQWALDKYNVRAGVRSDITLYSSLALAVSTPLVQESSDAWWQQALVLGVLCAEVNALNYAATEFVKKSVQRPRPFVYGSSAPSGDYFSPDARKSFFSGHSSTAAANAVFFAKVWSDYHPHSKWKPWIWGLASALPLYTAWQRIEAGKHFPSDVLAGLAVGASLGYTIPLQHKKK